MSDRPSDQAIAQAFWERAGYDEIHAANERVAIYNRARQIDAGSRFMRRDAERYRWLRDAAKTTDFTCPRWTVARESGGMGQTYRGVELDTAIDAAIRESSGESNG